MTRKTRAAVLVNTGEPLEIFEQVEIPELMRGQVLVDIAYSGLCHSQLAEVRGHRGEDRYLPHLLGHEAVGTVLEVGDEVAKVSIGDKVVLGWIKGEGINASGAIYRYRDMDINSGGVTTFSEQTVVSENRLVKLPDGIPDKLAVLLGCALPTGMGLVLNEVNVPEGSSVVVCGLGGVGLSALIAASTRRPKFLIAIDIEDHKLALARELGATHILNSNAPNFTQQFESICPQGVDFSFEAGGSVSSIELAFKLVRDGGGQCVFASHPKEGDCISLEPHAFHRGKKIQGSWGGGADPDRDIPKIVKLYSEGELPNLEKLLSTEYSLDEINEALDALENRTITRALINLKGGK